MSERKFTVGQKVLIREPYSRNAEPQEFEVSKVGRTLVYVKRWGSDWAFDMATGGERRGPNAGGFGAQLYTLDGWADRQRRSDIVDALAKHGFAPKGYGGFDQSTRTLARVLEVLTTEDAPE